MTNDLRRGRIRACRAPPTVGLNGSLTPCSVATVHRNRRTEGPHQIPTLHPAELQRALVVYRGAVAAHPQRPHQLGDPLHIHLRMQFSVSKPKETILHGDR